MPRLPFLCHLFSGGWTIHLKTNNTFGLSIFQIWSPWTFLNVVSRSIIWHFKTSKYLHRNNSVTWVHTDMYRYSTSFPGPCRCKKNLSSNTYQTSITIHHQKKVCIFVSQNKTFGSRKNLFFHLILLHSFLTDTSFLGGEPPFFSIFPPHPPTPNPNTVTLKLPLLSDAKYLALQLASSAMRCLAEFSTGLDISWYVMVY